MVSTNNTEVRDNIIFNHVENGIYGWGDNISIINNTITNPTHGPIVYGSGIGLHETGTNWQIINNTFCNNIVDVYDFQMPFNPDEEWIGLKFDWYGEYDAAVSQVVIDTKCVPIPAAVWLLGSGLLGLIGIRRRI